MAKQRIVMPNGRKLKTYEEAAEQKEFWIKELPGTEIQIRRVEGGFNVVRRVEVGK